MAHNEIWIEATREDVFAIVADPDSYEHWVVGATDAEPCDDRWPQPGSTFRHRQGKGPFSVVDTTSVLECRAPERLLLEVRARPWFVGEVDLRFFEDRGGTRIEMNERATGGAAGLVPQRLLDPLIHARNAEAIRRLAAMAWQRHQLLRADRVKLAVAG